MAISPDLQMMLLALDAYNRGGGEKLVVNDLFTTIGDYTFYDSENDGTYQSSRYRAANGDRVLAFRGTDQVSDIIPGWLTGAGVPNTPQTRAALSSYEGVLSDIANDGGSGTLRLTGHSLGGGLAGLVAALRGGKEAYIFNSMPFKGLPDAGYDELISIERIELGDQKDIAKVIRSPQNLDLTTSQRKLTVDGGGQPAGTGDELDLSHAGPSIKFEKNRLKGTDLIFQNFEILTGTSGENIIKGAVEFKVIMG